MQLIKSDINIDFLGKQKIGFALSLILIIVSIGSLIIHKGPNYGIDFVGGTLVQIKFSQQVAVSDIRNGLSNLGLKDTSVQGFGQAGDNEYLVRTSSSETMENNLSEIINGKLML